MVKKKPHTNECFAPQDQQRPPQQSRPCNTRPRPLGLFPKKGTALTKIKNQGRSTTNAQGVSDRCMTCCSMCSCGRNNQAPVCSPLLLFFCSPTSRYEFNDTANRYHVLPCASLSQRGDPRNGKSRQLHHPRTFQCLDAPTACGTPRAQGVCCCDRLLLRGWCVILHDSANGYYAGHDGWGSLTCMEQKAMLGTRREYTACPFLVCLGLSTLAKPRKVVFLYSQQGAT